MYARRELYQSAPLALVTAELRLNYEPDLKKDDVRDAFASAVRSKFPILTSENVVTFAFQGVGHPSSDPEHMPQIRATTLDRSATVALNPTSLNMSMDGAAYATYEDSFEPLISAAVGALRSVLDTVVVERVGLRMIDEVRPPQPPTSATDWGTWINPQLLGSTGAFADGTAQSFRSSVAFQRESERSVTYSCGEFEGVTVVDQGLPFGRKNGKPSRMFVIDIDSAWEPLNFSRLDPRTITEVLQDLHRPVGEIFQWSITDEARKMFRREGGGE